MPHCEFMCLDCHKGFLKTLTGQDYEEGEVACPHCGSSRVELRITLPAKAKRAHKSGIAHMPLYRPRS